MGSVGIITWPCRYAQDRIHEIKKKIILFNSILAFLLRTKYFFFRNEAEITIVFDDLIPKVFVSDFNTAYGRCDIHA